MMVQLEWLPALVPLEKHYGDWDRYLGVLYAHFKADFLDSTPEFRGVRVGVKRYPVADGKEATFWHLISIGDDEAGRLPDLRRCERIRWPRPIIEHSDTTVVKVWRNKRKGKIRVCLWLETWEYLVVLQEHSSYVLLWTAYMVTEGHRKRKLQKEYEHYTKGQVPPPDGNGTVTPSTRGR